MGVLSGLVSHIGALRAKAAILPAECAVVAAPILGASIREVIGSHELRDLKPSTQAERERLGYGANDPLLRSGDYLRSIHEAAEGSCAAAGSDNPEAAYFEHGTAKMAPFHDMAIGLALAMPAVMAATEATIREVLEG